MPTLTEILFNFDKAEQVAQRIEEIAEILRKLARNDMTHMHQNIASAWKGNSSLSYLTKSSLLQADVLETYNSLTSVVNVIRTVAKTIRDAEIMVLNIAKGHGE